MCLWFVVLANSPSCSAVTFGGFASGFELWNLSMMVAFNNQFEICSSIPIAAATGPTALLPVPSHGLWKLLLIH